MVCPGCPTCESERWYLVSIPWVRDQGDSVGDQTVHVVFAANPTNGFAQCLRWCMAREARAPKLMEWGRTGTNKWLKVTSEQKVLINGRFPSKFMWPPRCWWFGAIPRYDLSGVGIPTMQGHPGQHLYPRWILPGISPGRPDSMPKLCFVQIPSRA